MRRVLKIFTFQNHKVLEQLCQGPTKDSVVLYPDDIFQRNGYRLNFGIIDTYTTVI